VSVYMIEGRSGGGPRNNLMKRKMGWGKVIFAHLVIIGVPTILYYYLRLNGVDMFPIHAAVATFYLITSLMIIWETTVAIFRRFGARTKAPTGALDRLGQRLKRTLGVTGARQPDPARPLPRCSLIVAAYLPNEQDIIVETITHILTQVRRPKDGLEVILAYNSPVRLPVMDALEDLARRHPEFRPLHVEGSESKAENLNAAIQVVTGEVTGILDADHHPHPDCLERAWRWLERDYDVVQGRSTIRNFDTNFQTRLVAVEFECMYGVAHPARSLMVDTAIFGGSNGYWRTGVLRTVRFDPHMMTEDIDASVRALLDGRRIVADRSIVSSELAPAEFRGLWFQRKRWAQGWLEVSLKYQPKVWSSKQFTLGQKIYWTYLLYYREIYPIASLQIFPIIFSLLLYQGSMPLITHWYLWVTAVVTLLSGPYQTVAAAKNSVTRYPLSYSVVYALCVLFYVMVKNMNWILAFYDHMLGINHWVVTRRQIDERLKRRLEKA